jgi:competence protein ComEA
MADGTRRGRRARSGTGARTVAEAEADLSDDVRRRLRASSRVLEGWVPSAPDNARVDTALEDGVDQNRSHAQVGSAQISREEASDEEVLEEEILDEEIDADDTRRDRDARRESNTASTADRLWAALRERVPLGFRGADLVPSRPAVAGLAGLLVAALALALGLTWLQRPHESPVPTVARSVPAGAVVSVPPTATPSAGVVVHVTGAVRRPGLVDLPGGSRVDDAVAAAGGATRHADLATVNLARLLVDGEQIIVLRKGETPPAGAAGPSTGGTATPGQPVDLNLATLEQLDGLPGVGPVLAQRIIDYRTAHGRFSSVDELTDVSGIGERTLADLKPLVRV